jgi:Holliday junction resolvase
VRVFTEQDVTDVRNELDVVSIKDSILICISCKDSEKYDEDSLNELQVYSERLGGENAIKILVATRPPLKEIIAHRAKEMGIYLVIIDNDISKFKNKLAEIINKEGQ